MKYFRDDAPRYVNILEPNKNYVNCWVLQIFLSVFWLWSNNTLNLTTLLSCLFFNDSASFLKRELLLIQLVSTGIQDLAYINWQKLILNVLCLMLPLTRILTNTKITILSGWVIIWPLYARWHVTIKIYIFGVEKFSTFLTERRRQNRFSCLYCPVRASKLVNYNKSFLGPLTKSSPVLYHALGGCIKVRALLANICNFH